MRRRTLLTALSTAALGWRRALAAEGDPVPVIVVVGETTTLEDLSLPKLRALFLGELAFDAKGTKLLPFNHVPGSPLRVAFDRAVLRMEPDAVGRYWIDRRMRGQGSPPRAVEAVSLLKRVVARIPGAVSYLVYEPAVAPLRVLRIDGRTPGERGYPLVMRI